MADRVVGEIRRCNRNLLLTNTTMIIILVLLGYGFRGYLYNFFFGPFDLTEQTFHERVPSPGQKGNFFRVNSPEATDTGFRDIEQSVDKYTGAVTSETTSADYVAAPLNGRLLLVRVAKGKHAGPFEGELRSMPQDIQAKFIDVLSSQDERYKGAFVPALLDATGYRNPGYTSLAIAGALLALAAWNIRKFVSRNRDVSQHPIARSLRSYGYPSVVMSLIDGEASRGEGVVFNKVWLLPTWLVSPTFFGCAIYRVQDIVWVYKTVTRRYMYFVIPIGKTHALMVHDAQGRSLETLIGASEDMVNALMSSLAQQVPWAIFGYNGELERLWSKDRGGFAQAVATRRDQASAKKAG